MSLFFLILLGAAAGFAIGDLFSDDDGGGSGSEMPDDDGEVIRVDTAPGFVGTDEDDVFVFDPQASGGVVTSVDGGAGDDIINLSSLFDDQGQFGDAAMVGSSIAGGAGNDQISVEGEQNAIDGGSGNDTIFADSRSSTITGGEGDDLMRALNVSADASNVDGGAGNDTINVTGSDNINVTGGTGDDVLISDGRTIVGTGYTIGIDGGAGNDTLDHSVDVFPLPLQDPFEAAAVLTGGEGADVFDISLTTGNGSFSASDSDPAVFDNPVARITDFERGTDVLSLEIPTSLSGYTAESGVLTTDTANDLTSFAITLNGGSNGLPTQEIQIEVNGTNLTWDDVTFSGQTPASLTVA